ncbi:MAG: type II toxin-antitoxin system prevent-host-death family antitoxin [Burkholderiales bacterium]|nr:type II toxin-antitoxin system prevent-host-death family antitoxin [Burkholderiales bacterium]
MSLVPVAEAKNRLSELIARVEAGEEISVTRHGRPVVRLVCAKEADDSVQRARVSAALQRLAMLRSGVRLDDDLKTVARDGLD